MRSDLLLAALVVGGCSNHAPTVADVKLGTLGPALRELAQQTVCKDSPLQEQTSDEAARLLRPSVVNRLASKKLTGLKCDTGNLHITYASDDKALYAIDAFALTKEEAVNWLDALEQTGVDAALIARARERLATNSDDRSALETEDKARALVVGKVMSQWELNAYVLK